MTLGEIIKNYRSEHGLSQRGFANKCGSVSNGYISMIENDFNPTTSKKIIPSIDKLLALARGMNMPVQELIKIADDINVQNVDSETTVGERLMGYMLLYKDSAPEIARLLNITEEELERVIANDYSLSIRQCRLLAKRFGVDYKLFYDAEEQDERPNHGGGPIIDELITLLQDLPEDVQLQILGLVRVMSKEHKEPQDPIHRDP